jgi:hypothetical protein
MNIMIQPVAFASSSAWISYIALVMNIMIQPVAFVSSSAWISSSISYEYYDAASSF